MAVEECKKSKLHRMPRMPIVKLDGDSMFNVMYKIFKAKGISEKINPNEVIKAFKEAGIMNDTF